MLIVPPCTWFSGRGFKTIDIPPGRGSNRCQRVCTFGHAGAELKTKCWDHWAQQRPS